MPSRRIILLATVFLAAAMAGKKNPDDETQILAVPKDPPMVAIGETSHLIFNVSPLSAKGLLSQQTREALKAILKANGGAQVIHIRAFVAGSGDLRRVPQIVSEVFAAKKMPLPSVSVLEAGALPLENAQIVIEAVSAGKKEVNPDGLTFLEGKSPDQLASQLAGATALNVTCFAGSAGGGNSIAARFPSAAVDVVQAQRTPARAESKCEVVARGGKVKSTRLAFTGPLVAFAPDENAAALAFQRLDRELTASGIEASGIVETNVYALSERMGELARKIRFGIGAFLVIPVEGVSSVEGTFAIDSIATVPN